MSPFWKKQEEKETEIVVQETSTDKEEKSALLQSKENTNDASKLPDPMTLCIPSESSIASQKCDGEEIQGAVLQDERTENVDSLSEMQGNPKLPLNLQEHASDVHPELPIMWESLDTNDIRFLTFLVKYGCLSSSLREMILADQSPLKPCLRSVLQIVSEKGNEIYFLTEKSLQLYLQATGIPARDVAGKILFCEHFPQERLTQILQEIEILLAFEMACQQEKDCFLFDWLSPYNPRKKRMLKIRKPDGKRGSLKPGPVVVVKKNEQKCCLIFDKISCHSAFVPGERLAKFEAILKGYHGWLSAPEKVSQWVKKRGLYVSTEAVVVALLFPSEHKNMLHDLIHICEDLQINTAIYFADRNSFLEKPFTCWQACTSQERNLFVRAKCKKKLQ